MAQAKRDITLSFPSGINLIQSVTGGNAQASLNWSAFCKPSCESGLLKAQEYIDSECVRLMNPYTPRLTGVLIKSATIGSIVGSGEIEQCTPYARRQYYEHKGDGARGAKWFEVMKVAHLESIRKGAEVVAGARY